ncbi:hypothetical protein [Nocardia tengchongensis]|uniref:hypothetical protein n=1 Tax=Nocardia tengchongensis TaxID=2055889 RepID=UPI00360F8595
MNDGNDHGRTEERDTAEGPRPGEAFALQWSDVPDLSDQTVEKAVMRVGDSSEAVVGRAGLQAEQA